MKKEKLFAIGLLLCLIISCSRTSEEKPVETSVVWVGAVPMAFLQTGEQPIWFQLTENGPLHIETIRETAYSRAIVPWPLALHIRFLQEADGALVMAVNKDGFIKIAPNDGETPRLALYRFSGGEFFSNYTIGGLVLYDENPAVVLYLDDRFLKLDIPLPYPGTWSFNMNSNLPFPLEIPALQDFSKDEGWDVDTLRLGSDGMFYFRAAKRSGSQQAIRMFRTADLANSGKEISIEVFFNSMPRGEEISHPSLPPLPEGFFYTGIGFVGDSVFAAWEEQEDFSIGAAGFVVIKR